MLKLFSLQNDIQALSKHVNKWLLLFWKCFVNDPDAPSYVHIDNAIIPNIIIDDSIVSYMCWCLCRLLLLFYNCIGYLKQTEIWHGQHGFSMKCSSKLKMIWLLFWWLGFRLWLSGVNCFLNHVWKYPSMYQSMNHIAYCFQSVKSVKTMSAVKVTQKKTSVNAQTVVIVKNSGAWVVEHCQLPTLKTLWELNIKHPLLFSPFIIVDASFVQLFSHFIALKNELGIQNSEVAPLLSTS